MRLVQQFEHSKKQEFIALEKEFAGLQDRGVSTQVGTIAPYLQPRSGKHSYLASLLQRPVCGASGPQTLRNQPGAHRTGQQAEALFQGCLDRVLRDS